MRDAKISKKSSKEWWHLYNMLELVKKINEETQKTDNSLLQVYFANDQHMWEA